ncbi:hypothetical protein RJZ90_007163 [Blastomyces dermatitidis]
MFGSAREQNGNDFKNNADGAARERLEKEAVESLMQQRWDQEKSREWFEAKVEREREEKSVAANKRRQEEIEEVLEREAKKPKLELAEEEGIGALFRSRMRSMIQDIEEAALLSGHANLLAAGVEPEAADQEMRDFGAQVDLAGGEQREPSPEEAAEGDFEVVITSDEEEEKEEEEEEEKDEEWIVEDGKENEEEKE